MVEPTRLPTQRAPGRTAAALMLACPLLMAAVDGAARTMPDLEWPQHGRDPGAQRFAQISDITPDNVGRLGVAWYADFDVRSLRGVEATPLVVDGVMYVSGAWSVVMALDARTGRKLWSWDPKIAGDVARNGCCDVVNRGVAVDQGRVFASIYDGRLVALDARTGRPVWSVQTTDPAKPYTITGAPRVIGRRVIIGNGGAEYATRGYLSGYDTATGELAWRFHITPGNPAEETDPTMRMAARTWTGEWWKVGGGGNPWDSMAYDPKLDLLYVGTGNGGPWNGAIRSPGGGDNLFLSSIVALRPETGKYVWHFQEVPGDEWDYTATAPIVLADLKIGGRLRKVLMQAPKNGYFYVLDRTDGRFISGRNYAPVTWSSGLDPVTGKPNFLPGARYSETGKPFLGLPSPAGAHSWQAMSFSPATGLAYFPISEIPYGYIGQKPADFRMSPRGWNTGQDMTQTPMPEDPAVRAQIRGMVKGGLMAWNPVQQRAAWTVPLSLPWNGGTLATSGGLVFQGSGLGEFAAFDARSGRKLWAADLGTGIVAPPITYRLDGVQYVSIAVGWGGILPLNLGEVLKGAAPPRINRVVTFRLDGTVHPPVPEARVPAPLAPPPNTASAEAVAQGRVLFANHCWMCHGDTGVNRGAVPDLRRSPAIGNAALFDAFVLKGAGTTRGMPNFSKDLTAADTEKLRAYLVKRANDLKATPGAL